MKNWSKCLFLCLFCLSFLLFGQQQYAMAAYRIEITAQVLNVREGASTAYDIVAQIQKGEQFTTVAEKDGWYKITLADGKEGWILALYTKVVDQAYPDYVKLAGGTVNIRSGPGTNYAVIGSFLDDMVLPVLTLKGDWYQIQMTDGSTGWVASWLMQAALDLDKPTTGDNNSSSDNSGKQRATVDSDTLNLRAKPDNNGTIISRLTRGTNMTILARSGDWYYIRTETGKEGYVPFLYIRYLDTATSSVTSPTAAAPTMFWNGFGEPPGTANVTFQKVSLGMDIVLESQGHIDYQLTEMRNGKGLELITDCALNGELANGILNDAIHKMAWTGEHSNGISIEWQKELYYDIEQSADGKMITLHIGTSPLIGKTIVIDAGHGGYKTSQNIDVGAVGASGLQESDITLDITLKTQKKLMDAGAKVILTRNGYSYLTLEERAWVSNVNNADIFLSIHVNSFTSSAAKGASTWIYAPADNSRYNRAERLRLAECLQNQIVAQTGLSNYGIREDRFVVIRESLMPSALIETAFISNPEEEKLLGTESFRAQYAQAITSGLADFFK